MLVWKTERLYYRWGMTSSSPSLVILLDCLTLEEEEEKEEAGGRRGALLSMRLNAWVIVLGVPSPCWAIFFLGSAAPLVLGDLLRPQIAACDCVLDLFFIFLPNERSATQLQAAARCCTLTDALAVEHGLQLSQCQYVSMPILYLAQSHTHSVKS